MIVTDAGRGRWTRQRFARDGIVGQVGERPVSDQRRADERCCSVRRSRVVLTPRRWRQVRGCRVGPSGCRQTIFADDGGKQARSPGSSKETVKTIACGNAGRFRGTRCYSCALYHYHCTRGRGCNGHPAFPTPSLGERFINASGASRREGVNVCLDLTSLGAKRSNPFFLTVARWIASLRSQ